MTTSELVAALKSAASRYGYAFLTGPPTLISTHTKKLPVAWLIPPQLDQKYATNNEYVVYTLSLYILEKRALAGNTGHEEQWDSITKKIIRLVSDFEEDENIRSVWDLKIKLPSEPITSQNECSASITFKVAVNS